MHSCKLIIWDALIINVMLDTNKPIIMFMLKPMYFSKIKHQVNRHHNVKKCELKKSRIDIQSKILN